MLGRIAWAYLGTVGLPLFFLPFAFLNNMDGQSFLYVTILMAPLGLIIALADHDSRQHIDNRRKLYRSLFAAIAFCIFIGIVLGLNEAFPTDYMMNNGWLLLLIACPIWVAVLSNLVFRKRT